MKDQNELKRALARAESRCDLLEYQWAELERLLKSVGFAEGVVSLRKSIEQLARGEQDLDESL